MYNIINWNNLILCSKDSKCVKSNDLIDTIDKTNNIDNKLKLLTINKKMIK